MPISCCVSVDYCPSYPVTRNSVTVQTVGSANAMQRSKPCYTCVLLWLALVRWQGFLHYMKSAAVDNMPQTRNHIVQAGRDVLPGLTGQDGCLLTNHPPITYRLEPKRYSVYNL